MKLKYLEGFQDWLEEGDNWDKFELTRAYIGAIIMAIWMIVTW